eukprot:125235_1
MSVHSTKTKSTCNQTSEASIIADIILQLRKFYYGYRDIRDAMDNVTNPMDINEIMDYIDSKSESDDDLADLYMTKEEHVISLTETNTNKSKYFYSNIWNKNAYNFHDKNGTRINIIYLLNCATLKSANAK